MSIKFTVPVHNKVYHQSIFHLIGKLDCQIQQARNQQYKHIDSVNCNRFQKNKQQRHFLAKQVDGIELIHKLAEFQSKRHFLDKLDCLNQPICNLKIINIENCLKIVSKCLKMSEEVSKFTFIAFILALRAKLVEH